MHSSLRFRYRMDISFTCRESLYTYSLFLPEHGFPLHMEISSLLPMHDLPKPIGAGLVQSRCLVFSPPSHVSVHKLHGDQAVQPPCTITNTPKSENFYDSSPCKPMVLDSPCPSCETQCQSIAYIYPGCLRIAAEASLAATTTCFIRVLIMS